VLVGSALLSGVFAVVIGLLFPFGGPIHGAAAVLFGLWFITCLILAVRAIRRDDVYHHRRWMIRAFAVGVAVVEIGRVEADDLPQPVVMPDRYQTTIKCCIGS
jgi:uncharacterized membrane protein